MNTMEELAVLDRKAVELTCAIAVLEREVGVREGFEKSVMIHASNMLHMERLKLTEAMFGLEKRLIEEHNGELEAVRREIAKLPRYKKDGIE